MYTATVQITIDNGGFVPYNPTNPAGSSIKATIGAAMNTSAKGSGGSKVFSSDSGSGQTITITRPQGYTGAVQLTFQLASPDYVLAGIAVNSKTPAGGGASPTAGRQQFRTVTINRDQSGSQMIVTDALTDDANYSYLILVQAVTGANAGQIGAIDPDIDNDGGE